MPSPPEDRAWPRIGHEPHDWSSSIDPGRLTVFERIRLERPYQAAVVPEIAGAQVHLGSSTLALAHDAGAEMARFDAEVAQLPMSMPAVLLRSESASSSQIEHLTSSVRNIALAELGLGDKPHAAMIVANSRAMTAAIDAGDRITPETILRIHEQLLVHEPDHAGRWRAEQVWIGASAVSPHGADYVAPHHGHISRLMEDLTLFADRSDIPAVVHAAIVHAQFETIHPFVDGNGRTGRVLLHTMLRRSGVAVNTTVPVSAGLLRDTNAYFRALTAYRAGEPGEIVEQVAHAAIAAVSNSRQLAAETTEIRDRWRSGIRARRDAAAWALADALFARPVIDVRVAAELTGGSERSALNAIDTLVDAGVLTPMSSARRGRVWQAQDVLTAAEAFVRRAGRRSVGR